MRSEEATDFSYRLVVLTHGDSEPLPRTLESFRRMVTPMPTSKRLHVDAALPDGCTPETPCQVDPWFAPEETFWDRDQRGFCEAVRDAWMFNSSDAVEPAESCNPEPFVFWLEHDFEFLKPVNLAELATVLRAEPQVAQMSLMRGAVNPLERRAGGLYALHRREYQPVTTHAANDWLGGLSLYSLQWLEHHMYYTTNANLMRTEFMRDNPWPIEYAEHCEGRFSHDLMARGYRFGVWGNGEQWIDHIGERTGFGY